MSKTARQVAIKEILTASTITSQEDLKHELGRRGYRVTQATLSRDMKELGVNWVTRGGVQQYVLPAGPEAAALRPIVGAEVTGINANESLIVVHTIPGAAHTVGEFIDVQHNRDIIGTVAGDNTLLVIPGSARATATVVAWLRQILFDDA
jgi:transcriptional regulator of arginine metabolism